MIYDEEQYAIFSAAFQRAVKEGIPYDIELMLKLPHNRVKWVQAICKPDVKKGDAGYFLRGTIQDITKLKEQEKKLQQYSEQLEKILDIKDKFFSIIAHDLRGPIISLLSGTEMLEEQLHDTDDEFIRFMSNELYKSSERVYKLLDNLLTWALMQQGEISFEPQNIDVYHLVGSVCSLIYDGIIQKNIDLICLIPEGTVVCADQNMLQMVFRNLIGNAVKFTNEGGKITVDAQNKGGILEFCVIDNGVGIPEEKIERLFREDEKYISTLGTNSEKGTGLGLILCKEFIEKHGGKIWVTSKVGEGSTFAFSLPKRLSK